MVPQNKSVTGLNAPEEGKSNHSDRKQTYDYQRVKEGENK